MEHKPIVSSSPHIHSGDTIEKNMYGVLVALIPTLLAAFYTFGTDALITVGTSVLSCVVLEYLITKFIMKRTPTQFDGSAIITGLLMAFCLPPNVPIWAPMLGSLFAIGIIKLAFGGLGKNIFNPAAAGYAFLLIISSIHFFDWKRVVSLHTSPNELWVLPHSTSLAHILFLGQEAQTMGAISILTLLLGLGWLLGKRIITWHIPVSITFTIVVFSGILHLSNPNLYPSPLFHFLSGSVMLGAIFMATDYVTSPMTKKGKLIYGAGIGLLTIIFHLRGFYHEGIIFSILTMNIFSRFIDKVIRPKRFSPLTTRVN